MGIILKKPGQTPAAIPAALPPAPPTDTEWKSPFRTSYHAEPPAGAPAKVEAVPAIKSPAPEPAPEPVAQVTAAPAVVTVPTFTGMKPKAVLKIMGGKPVKPGVTLRQPTPSVDPTADLVAAGLADEPRELTSAERWPAVSPGSFVVITNTHFPWVKHYKPGDVARVTSSSPTHSLPEDPYKYRSYFLEIVSDGPTKGQKPMLFRWEFEPRPDAAPAPKIEGRVITQS